MLPVDFEVYTFDMEGANNNDTPSWNLYMKVKDEYSMKDLSPASFKNLSLQVATEKDVCTKYKYNSKVGGSTHVPVACTADDQTYYSCQMSSSDSDDLYKCKFGDSFWTSFKFDEQHLLIPIINNMNHHWYKQI